MGWPGRGVHDSLASICCLHSCAADKGACTCRPGLSCQRVWQCCAALMQMAVQGHQIAGSLGTAAAAAAAAAVAELQQVMILL